MKIRSWLRRISLLALLAIAGCSGPRVLPTPNVVPDGFPNHSVAQILDQLEFQIPKIDAMDTRTSLSLVSTEMTENVTALIRFDRRTALYASIRATILNAEVGRSLVTPDSFFVYNRIEKELHYGPIALAGQYIPISGSLLEIHQILTGGWLPGRYENWQISVADDHYILSDADSMQEFEIDPGLWKVVRYTHKNRSGRILDERIFGNYSEFNGVVLPRRIVLKQPSEGRTVAMFHRSVTPHPATQRFDLGIDRNRVKQILIGG